VIAVFPLGRIVATAGVLGALERANQSAALFLARHAGGDSSPLHLRLPEFLICDIMVQI